MYAVGVQLAPGESHSMVLVQDGSVWSTGLNSDHQLGIELPEHHVENFERAFSSGVKCVAAGHSHSIALKKDNTVWATGRNTYGQLGDGTTTDKDHFGFVQVFHDATAVAAGGWHSMLLTAAGDVWVTGWNSHGQLGDDEIFGSSHSFSSIWRHVLRDAKAIAAGHLHSIVLKQDGIVWAAGRNDHGQLGDWSRLDKSTFVASEGPDGRAVYAIAVAAGGYHTLALTKDGRVLVAGWNMYGQHGDIRMDRDTFQQVFTDVKAIAAGTRHSMILVVDDSLWATGCNEHGQLGDGSTEDRFGFTKVIPDGVEAIAAGGYHSMVLKKDGSIWATGANEFGQIGDSVGNSTESFVKIANTRTGLSHHFVFG